MAIALQLGGTIEFLLGQITWTIVNPDKHFYKKGNWVLVCLTDRLVGKIQEDTSIPIARETRAVIYGWYTAVVLCWMWVSNLAKQHRVQSRDSVYQQRYVPNPVICLEPGHWTACAEVIPTCVFYLCDPDLRSCFRVVTTWFLGPPGAKWPSRCHMSEEFSFHLLHGALLFFLFNWLGREKVSWDVNKDNESLPKVKPSRRQWDVLIKWSSSEGRRVTVQEGESLRTIRSTRRGEPPLKLASFTQRQLQLHVRRPSIQVRKTRVAITHPLFM
jgi:hypothetical protein